MEPMDTTDWRNLEQVEGGNVLLDSRSLLDKGRIAGLLKLYEAGYCTLIETGPGDSVHIFAISEAGKEALEARRRNSS